MHTESSYIYRKKAQQKCIDSEYAAVLANSSIFLLPLLDIFILRAHIYTEKECIDSEYADSSIFTTSAEDYKIHVLSVWSSLIGWHQGHNVWSFSCWLCW